MGQQRFLVAGRSRRKFQPYLTILVLSAVYEIKKTYSKEASKTYGTEDIFTKP